MRPQKMPGPQDTREAPPPATIVGGRTVFVNDAVTGADAFA